MTENKRGAWLIMGLVFGVALALRLVLLARVEFPGLWDPLHYAMLGENLLAGRGFTIDYIWHFAGNPAGVTHPIDHWLPLPGILAAGGMALGGVNAPAAVLPFAVLGAVQAALTVWFARRIGGGLPAQLLAGLGAMLLPSLLVASIHSDTTIPFSVFVMLALAGMWLAFTEDGRWLWLGGLASGLALLTRNDALLLLPTLAVCAVVYGLRGGRVRWVHYAGYLGLFLLVMAPWLARNAAVLGEPWPGSVAASAFVRDHEEFYVYSTSIDLAHYLDWGAGNIAGKWLFELAASLKLMAAESGPLFGTLVAGLLVIGVGWGLLRWRARAAPELDRLAEKLLWPLLPALVLVLGAWVFYGVVTPFLSQGGSFKKLFLGVLPLLLAGGAALAMELLPSRAARWGLALLAGVMLLPGAFDAARNDMTLNRDYAASVVQIGVVLDELAAEMDREMIVMARDPWTIHYLKGYRTVMIPLEDLPVILEAADRYAVTHILLPAPRPALEGVYAGTGAHPRLRLAAEVPQTAFRVFEVLPPG
ncbi:MAG: glycosyltransferase family 39 protein [Anaerolineae bacterium]|nr:glycosyltransferase family 39 protein [Anaerolineae bacterium]